jgi:hypothetical protein
LIAVLHQQPKNALVFLKAPGSAVSPMTFSHLVNVDSEMEFCNYAAPDGRVVVLLRGDD